MRDNIERERRFLVGDKTVLAMSEGNDIEQGYLFAVEGWAVRVRRTRLPDNGRRTDAPAQVTVKGPRIGVERSEYEMQISVEHAAELIALAPWVVRKKRHQIVSEGNIWDIDVFEDQNEGLVIAECEMDEGIMTLRRPWWCSEEITLDHRYNNENLARQPFSTW